MEHTAVEKALKADIVAKNTLLKKIRRMRRQAGDWQRKAESLGNRRRQKKYRATAERFLDELSRLRPQARRMVEELDGRIHEEMKFSRDEVKAFKEQLRLETEEMEKISRELGEVEKKLEADKEKLLHRLEEGTPEKSAPGLKKSVAEEEAEEAQLKKKARREEKSVKKLEQELESEAADKKQFAQELKRLDEEKEILGETEEAAGGGEVEQEKS